MDNFFKKYLYLKIQRLKLSTNHIVVLNNNKKLLFHSMAKKCHYWSLK